MESERISFRGIVAVMTITAMFMATAVIAARTWSVGAAINTPSISEPVANALYGLRTKVALSYNGPTDSDHWVDKGDSGNANDPTIAASWDDGAADGNFPDVHTYITPATTGDVTLTVTFDDEETFRYNDASKTDNVTITVVDAKMIFKVGGAETSEITRAASGTFEVVDENGDEIDGATYANWEFDGVVDVSDETHTSRTWGGTIVQSGTVGCDVTFDGQTCYVSKTITCNARTGWSLTPTCATDNELGWGSYPGLTSLGLHRDRVSDTGVIITPRGTNFQDGYTTAHPTSGPNKNVYYISASTFEIDMETVINKFAKSGATGYPDPPNINWHEYNESQSVDAGGLLTGLKGHECRGTPGNAEGHQKYLEDEEAKAANDVKAAIEDNVAVSDAALKTATGSEVSTIDTAILNAAGVEPSGNWGPGTVYYYSSGWNTTSYGN